MWQGPILPLSQTIPNMKGIVFTEFLDMVEKAYGYDVVDYIIESSDLPSSGIYTAVGTYSHAEIVQLLTNLSEKVKVDPAKLLKIFGRYIFDTFLLTYPQFFERMAEPFEFLESIDKHIHVEVRKLYPDATLPRFTTEMNEGPQMTMIYHSERKMADFAEGLIEKSFEHFKEQCRITSRSLEADGTVVEFTIQKL